MIYLAMIFKSLAWSIAFWTGIGRRVHGMLLQSVAITVLLTMADKFTMGGDLSFRAMLLTLLLYGLMSFLLISVAWKLKNPAVSLACNVTGTMGAFAMVNFTIVFVGPSLPFMN